MAGAAPGHRATFLQRGSVGQGLPAAVPLVALRPTQWDALDTLHHGIVRRLYGLPRSPPIGPTLAESGETSLSLRARGNALRHIHRMYLLSEGRRLAGRLLDRPHSGMGQHALEAFRSKRDSLPESSWPSYVTAASFLRCCTALEKGQPVQYHVAFTSHPGIG
ncbi:hypothetical protein MRX96_003633 [Rhipicephalus microplus]